MNDIDRQLFEDEIPEIFCSCGEMMEEEFDLQDENVRVFDCAECGRRKFFNAHTGADITEDFIIARKEMD